MTVETKFESANVSVRIKIAALWTSMLFVFAYVDIFSLYRPDFRRSGRSRGTHRCGGSMIRPVQQR